MDRQTAFSLQTPRLRLRPPHDGDIETFVAYRCDPDVARYQGWDIPYGRSQALDLFAEMQKIEPGTRGAWYQVAIERRRDGQMLGDCAFCIQAQDARQAEIGFTLARAHQGQGYATEAVKRLIGYLFTARNLHRVFASCDVENHASARLLERIGMRREAHFIESLWFKGHWSSEYWYAMLRREWQAHVNENHW
jgi:aminoglycoside 6'-N-acetyltransferase